jgi:Histidine-specific methyltransferase, SAM-dependent
MHLVSMKEQKIIIDGQTIVLREGETLHTENSYKFSVAGIQQLAIQAGLRPGRAWLDPKQWFGLLWFDIPPQNGRRISEKADHFALRACFGTSIPGPKHLRVPFRDSAEASCSRLNQRF